MDVESGITWDCGNQRRVFLRDHPGLEPPIAENHRSTVYQQRRQQGRCTSCGGRIDSDRSKVECSRCLNVRKARMALARQKKEGKE